MEPSATPSPDQPDRSRTGLARFSHLAGYARTALIAGAAVAVVCLVLLVIIFLLDSFNATVYSVGGKDINDATDEARQIRGAVLGGPHRRRCHPHRLGAHGRRLRRRSLPPA